MVAASVQPDILKQDRKELRYSFIYVHVYYAPFVSYDLSHETAQFGSYALCNRIGIKADCNRIGTNQIECEIV